MPPNFVLTLLLFAISASSLKYVYIEEARNWEDAQHYCRETFTDLAPVSSKYDMKLLRRVTERSLHTTEDAWFGLMRNTTDFRKWMWSGGAEVTTFFWDTGEPGLLERFGLLRNNKWHDADLLIGKKHFICYKVQVVRERMTWEEALEYCRENHEDLASVASETEMMLIQKELQKHQSITENIWVGLRFLAEEWLWTDGQPLDYEAWGRKKQTQCPTVRRCGALRVNGTHNDTDEEMVHVDNIEEWNGRDCTRRLHFLCY